MNNEVMLRYLLSGTHSGFFSSLCVCVFFFFPSLSTDEFNPEVPKLEKSVSGSSPSHDRLLLSVAMLLVSFVLLS